MSETGGSVRWPDRKVGEGVSCPNGHKGRLRWSGPWRARCAECGWEGSIKPQSGRKDES